MLLHAKEEDLKENILFTEMLTASRSSHFPVHQNHLRDAIITKIFQTHWLLVSCQGRHMHNISKPPDSPSSFSVSSQPELKRSQPAFSPATLVQIRCCLNIFQQLPSDSQDASAPTVTEWMTN